MQAPHNMNESNQPNELLPKTLTLTTHLPFRNRTFVRLTATFSPGSKDVSTADPNKFFIFLDTVTPIPGSDAELLPQPARISFKVRVLRDNTLELIFRCLHPSLQSCDLRVVGCLN